MKHLQESLHRLTDAMQALLWYQEIGETRKAVGKGQECLRELHTLRVEVQAVRARYESAGITGA
jgi:hypothetical protein